MPDFMKGKTSESVFVGGGRGGNGGNEDIRNVEEEEEGKGESGEGEEGRKESGVGGGFVVVGFEFLFLSWSHGFWGGMEKKREKEE